MIRSVAAFALFALPLVARAEQRAVTFDGDVRAIFAERCLSCHGPDEQESSLRVDVRKTLLAGGDSGEPAVVPGKSEAGELIARVTSTDPLTLMPPEGKRLTEQQVAALKSWIDAGAKMPETFTITKSVETDHWAFQPVRDVKPPLGGGTGVSSVDESRAACASPGKDVPRKDLRRDADAAGASKLRTKESTGKMPVPHDAGCLANPIDAFVLRKLREKELDLAPPADRRTLIRRLTFDLTGLPPTPDEVSAFLADDSPDAYARLVERLLDSPAYGERWARHWLDVVRYADTNGLDENVAHGNAWRYRDWVVNALNADKPFDEFVREQLAGDLLPSDDEATRRQRIVATGFLSLGPKVLAEVDETKMEMDIVDEQIDTFGKAFLGLTLGCARCHDHKFDPVTAEDYYALAGVFKSTRTMDSFTKIAKWHEVPIPTEADRERQAEHETKVAAKKSEIAEVVKKANAALLNAAGPEAKLPEKPEEQYPEETKAELKSLREELAAIEKAAPVMPTAMGVSDGEVTDVAVHLRGSHLSLGDVVPRRVPEVLRNADTPRIGDDSSGRLELANWLTDGDHPLTARVMVNRVWRWHFGRGLVATTDNFGELGEPPTHPDLLDWLATRFVEDGWSLKSLHRLIVTSHTYRQSALHDERAAAVDTANRLYWRHRPRRLEAEAIRDAMLAVSGRLDRTMGGSLLNTENRKHVFDHTSKDQTSYDSDRRSLYLPVVRNHLYDLFQLFDYSDASTVTGNRPTSTVAPQALFLMNAEFVEEQSDALAERLLQSASDDKERVRRLHELAYARPATEAELQRSLAYVDRATELLRAEGVEDARARAWSTLCQTTFASSEFVTLR